MHFCNAKCQMREYFFWYSLLNFLLLALTSSIVNWLMLRGRHGAKFMENLSTYCGIGRDADMWFNISCGDFFYSMVYSIVGRLATGNCVWPSETISLNTFSYLFLFIYYYYFYLKLYLDKFINYCWSCHCWSFYSFCIISFFISSASSLFHQS